MATKLKTNKAMRLGSVMLVLALLTTCAISGTFAKYTTDASATATARVAKWGFSEASISLDDLFAQAYTGTQGAKNTVEAATDVIAPGTSNSADFQFVADGTAPEVAYTLSVTTTGSTCDDTIKNNKNIKWKLDDGSWGTWDQLITNINNLATGVDGTTVYAPGTLPDGLDGTHTITWAWAFDNTSDPHWDTQTVAAQDATDTGMGNAETLAKVTLKINVQATQVD